jgi:hypothetical protein
MNPPESQVGKKGDPVFCRNGHQKDAGYPCPECAKMPESQTGKSWPPRVWHDIKRIGKESAEFLQVNPGSWASIASFSFQRENDYTEEYLSVAEAEAIACERERMALLRGWKEGIQECIKHLPPNVAKELLDAAVRYRYKSAHASEAQRTGEEKE